MYMNIFLAYIIYCMLVCLLCVLGACRGQKRTTEVPEIGVKNESEPPCGC